MEAPKLQKVYENYQDQGVMVLAIGVDQNQASCLNWINRHGLTHPVLADPTRKVWRLFSMGYVPHNTVTGCDDVISYTWYGYDENAIKNAINAGLPYMIQFDHMPILWVPEWTPFTITAEITANSAFSTGYPKVFYRIDGALWTSEEMIDVGNDTFEFDFPGQSPGSTFDYYFRAEQTAGCPRSYPGPRSYFSIPIGSPTPTPIPPTATPIPPTATPNPPTATPEPTSTPTPDCINNGDVNQDTLLTAADAQLTFLIALGTYTPTEIEACSADCNGDNSVSAADAQEIFLAAIEGGSCADPL